MHSASDPRAARDSLPRAGLTRRSLLVVSGLGALSLAVVGAAPASASATTLARLRVGARVRTVGSTGPELASSFRNASAAKGPWDITRAFYGTLPTSEQPITPKGGVDVVSYKTPQKNLAAYVATMRKQDLITWHHEPEGPKDGFTPAGYRNAFVKEYAAAHQARASVKFGMISGGFQWREGNPGYGGGFLPPKGSVDWLGFDSYRTGAGARNAVVPLTQVAEFQSWYAIAKTYGVPLYVTEYGRGSTTVPGSGDQRPSVIRADHDYLTANNFAGWIFWYPENGIDKQWYFTDSSSLAALRSVSTGS